VVKRHKLFIYLNQNRLIQIEMGRIPELGMIGEGVAHP